MQNEVPASFSGVFDIDAFAGSERVRSGIIFLSEFLIGQAWQAPGIGTVLELRRQVGRHGQDRAKSQQDKHDMFFHDDPLYTWVGFWDMGSMKLSALQLASSMLHFLWNHIDVWCAHLPRFISRQAG
jgi:hypothetical protein